MQPHLGHEPLLTLSTLLLGQLCEDIPHVEKMFLSHSKTYVPGCSVGSMSVHGCLLRIGISQPYPMLALAQQVPLLLSGFCDS